MKVLVVGGGGREHTVIRKLKENPEITQIFALPGNGGMAQDAECVPIDAKDIASIVTFAVSNDIDYAVVTPDDPLVRMPEFPVSVPAAKPPSSKAARSSPKT